MPQLKQVYNTVYFTLLFKRNKNITDFKSEPLDGSHQSQTYCRSGMDKLEPGGPLSSPAQTHPPVALAVLKTLVNWYSGPPGPSLPIPAVDI